MLLPQSSAFAALKNRLNSVSNIGLLQTGTKTWVPYSHSIPKHADHFSFILHTDSGFSATSTATPSYERPTAARLGKVRENEPLAIRWTDLLDKFRATQERWRRWKDRTSPYLPAFGSSVIATDDTLDPIDISNPAHPTLSHDERSKSSADILKNSPHSSIGRASGAESLSMMSSKPLVKGRTALGNLSRLGIGQRKPKRWTVWFVFSQIPIHKRFHSAFYLTMFENTSSLGYTIYDFWWHLRRFNILCSFQGLHSMHCRYTIWSRTFKHVLETRSYGYKPGAKRCSIEWHNFWITMTSATHKTWLYKMLSWYTVFSSHFIYLWYQVKTWKRAVSNAWWWWRR